MHSSSTICSKICQISLFRCKEYLICRTLISQIFNSNKIWWCKLQWWIHKWSMVDSRYLIIWGNCRCNNVSIWVLINKFNNLGKVFQIRLSKLTSNTKLHKIIKCHYSIPLFHPKLLPLNVKDKFKPKLMLKCLLSQGGTMTRK